MRALAKLTLSLRVTGIRADGMHLIDSQMVTVDLADQIDFAEGDGLDITGPFAVSGGPDNLVSRALQAVGRRAHVTLVKNIPSGGGLGGGSADAAAVLRWAGETSPEVAAGLGADVPFCLVGGRARVSGIGEIIEPLPERDQVFTLLTPPFGVPTPAVYAMWDRLGGPVADGPNDLQPAALAVEPRLAKYRRMLQKHSGQVPILAGSGSTWFVEGEFPGPGFVVTRTDRP